MYSHYRNLHDGLFVDWGKTFKSSFKILKILLTYPHWVWITYCAIIFIYLCLGVYVKMLESDIYTVHFFQCTELFGVKSVIISRIVSHFQNCRNIIYIYIWKRESLSYLISWNVCYVDIVVFMRLKVHNKINTAGAKSHKYFAAFFWVQKWTFTCFCFFFLSTNLTNVTICGKLYEFY